MPSETLNRVEDLLERIGYPDDNTDEADLQQVLEEAHRDTIAGVGRAFVEDKRVRTTVEDSGDLVKEFDLKFPQIYEIQHILLNQQEQINDSNYTIDKENGKITFDQDFVDEELFKNQIIRFKYIPVQFKDIELWHAIHIIKNQEIINLEDSEQTALHRNAIERAKRLENQVNRMAGPGNATDGRIRRGTK